jgi:hypothetical protein
MPQPSKSRGRAEAPAVTEPTEGLDLIERATVALRTQLINNLRTAAAIVERSGADLPEILSVGVTAEEITIQPWLPGAPVQAALAFEKVMTAPIERRAFPNPLPDSEASGISLLSISGMIDSTKVTVTVSTYRDTPVDGFLGVTEQAVTALADAEEPIAVPGNDRVLAETLNSPVLMKAVERGSDDGADDPGDDGVGADAADPDPDGEGHERPEGAAQG